MPAFEELPDDYEESPSASVAASAPSAAESSSGRRGVDRESRPAADSASAGLKKGFFDRPAKSTDAPKKRPAAAPPAASEATVAAPASEVPAATASTATASAEVRTSSSPCQATYVAAEAEIASLLDSLRARLDGRGGNADGHEGLSEGVSEALSELREALTSSSLPASRWPTAQARTGLSKSSLEANTALAEMRSACNDARRMRSGEEKKHMTELRRVCDDVMDRVKKVVDLSAPRAAADEDKTLATVAAFHGLPFTAKLRLLADDRIALSLLAASFVAGMTLVMGIFFEVYSAWGCGYRCGVA